MTTVVGNISVIVQPPVVVLIVSNDMQEQTLVEHCGVVVETTASVFKYLIHNSVDLKFPSDDAVDYSAKRLFCLQNVINLTFSTENITFRLSNQQFETRWSCNFFSLLSECFTSSREKTWQPAM